MSLVLVQPSKGTLSKRQRFVRGDEDHWGGLRGNQHPSVCLSDPWRWGRMVWTHNGRILSVTVVIEVEFLSSLIIT